MHSDSNILSGGIRYLDRRQMTSLPSPRRSGATLVALVVLLSAVGVVVGVPAVDGESDADPSVETVQPSGHTGLTVTPSTLDFGTVAPGERATKTVTVSNDSPESINVSSVELSGDTDAFVVTEPVRIDDSYEFPGRTGTVPPGLSRTFTLAFVPDSPGEYSASMSVYDSDGTELASVSATGEMVSSGDISVSPQSLDFKGTTVGSTATRVVTVTNEGEGPLTVEETAIRGSDDYAVQNSGSFELATGESERVTVAFTPETTDSQSAILEIRSSDRDEPVVPVSLSNTDTQMRMSTTQREADRTTNVSVENARAGQPVNMTMPSTADEDESVNVDEISITPERDGNLSLSVTDSEDPLSTTPELETDGNATGLQYLNVSHSMPNEDIEEVQYRFRVRKDRVANLTTSPEELNRSRIDSDVTAGPDAITMYRHGPNGWKEEVTRHVRETPTHHVYVTSASGLSEWTTAAKQPDIRVADATASVNATTVGESVAIDVRLTNEGGADGVFVTRLLLNGDIVEERQVTVPDGGTVPVGFKRPFEETGTYQVTVNEVPVDTIEVTEQGIDQNPSDQQQDGSDDGNANGSGSGLSLSLPVMIGIGVILLLGALGGVLAAMGGGDDAEPAPEPTDDDGGVVEVEGFGGDDAAGAGDGVDGPGGEDGASGKEDT